ncbi:hypothetical protein [Streptomyces sp. NBC_00366]
MPLLAHHSHHTPATRTGLVRRRALDLYEAIPTKRHRECAVRELWNVLPA